ncbi:hypothetical protein [Streptomyces sp. GSL17-111]|uniref:hypothetical protein n=1 Tax=Streptomyces sp. GSL17-111 TaxID=3121596 RepID=UPI0030F431AE
MHKSTSHLITRLLALLLSKPGTHRAGRLAAKEVDTPTTEPPLIRRVVQDLPVITNAELVRPYVMTPEERRELLLGRARRRTLWLAPYGIDVGPRWIRRAGNASVSGPADMLRSRADTRGERSCDGVR